MLHFKTKNQNGEKGDLTDFEHSMVVDARQGDLSIYWDLPTQPSLGFTENVSNKEKTSSENALLILEDTGERPD